MHTTLRTGVRCAAAPGRGSGEGCGVSGRVCYKLAHKGDKLKRLPVAAVPVEKVQQLRVEIGHAPVPEGPLIGDLALFEVGRVLGT